MRRENQKQNSREDKKKLGVGAVASEYGVNIRKKKTAGFELNVVNVRNEQVQDNVNKACNNYASPYRPSRPAPPPSAAAFSYLVAPAG